MVAGERAPKQLVLRGDGAEAVVTELGAQVGEGEVDGAGMEQGGVGGDEEGGEEEAVGTPGADVPRALPVVCNGVKGLLDCATLQVMYIGIYMCV